MKLVMNLFISHLLSSNVSFTHHAHFKIFYKHTHMYLTDTVVFFSSAVLFLHWYMTKVLIWATNLSAWVILLYTLYNCTLTVVIFSYIYLLSFWGLLLLTLLFVLMKCSSPFKHSDVAIISPLLFLLGFFQVNQVPSSFLLRC